MTARDYQFLLAPRQGGKSMTQQLLAAACDTEMGAMQDDLRRVLAANARELEQALLTSAMAPDGEAVVVQRPGGTIRYSVDDVRRVLALPLRYLTRDGQEHATFPHGADCQETAIFDVGMTVMECAGCRRPFCWDRARGAFVEWGEISSSYEHGRLFIHDWAPRPEVDYARDLEEAPTFAEALAALEAHKARRAQEPAG